MARFTSHSRERVGQKNKARGGKNTITIYNRGKIPKPYHLRKLQKLREKYKNIFSSVYSDYILDNLMDFNEYSRIVTGSKNADELDMAILNAGLDIDELNSALIKKKVADKNAKIMAQRQERLKKRRLETIPELIKFCQGQRDSKVLETLAKNNIDIDAFNFSDVVDTTSKLEASELTPLMETPIYFDANEVWGMNQYYGGSYYNMKGYMLQLHGISNDNNYVRSFNNKMASMRVSEQTKYLAQQIIPMIQGVKSAFSRAPELSQNITFFHGGTIDASLKVGDIGEFLVPTSTSYNIDVAQEFASTEPDRYIVIVHAPKGMRGLHASSPSFHGWGGEHEVTFPPNQKFYVMSIHEEYDMFIFDTRARIGRFTPNERNKVKVVEVLLVDDNFKI